MKIRRYRKHRKEQLIKVHFKQKLIKLNWFLQLNCSNNKSKTTMCCPTCSVAPSVEHPFFERFHQQIFHSCQSRSQRILAVSPQSRPPHLPPPTDWRPAGDCVTQSSSAPCLYPRLLCCYFYPLSPKRRN